jgi:hypothetical protein
LFGHTADFPGGVLRLSVVVEKVRTLKSYFNISPLNFGSYLALSRIASTIRALITIRIEALIPAGFQKDTAPATSSSADDLMLAILGIEPGQNQSQFRVTLLENSLPRPPDRFARN